MEVNLPFLLCFTLYLRAIIQVQAPGGLIFGAAIKRRVFCVTGLGGLYLEGLLILSEFYSIVPKPDILLITFFNPI